MGLSLSGKTKPFCFGGRNALENVAQERSWFCPAIERALGLLPSLALSSHPTDLIVGSGQRKSIGLRLKTDCRRSTLNSLIFGLDIGEYLTLRSIKMKTWTPLSKAVRNSRCDIEYGLSCVDSEPNLPPITEITMSQSSISRYA